jgi:hypothetical protein
VGGGAVGAFKGVSASTASSKVIVASRSNSIEALGIDSKRGEMLVDKAMLLSFGRLGVGVNGRCVESSKLDCDWLSRSDVVVLREWGLKENSGARYFCLLSFIRSEIDREGNAFCERDLDGVLRALLLEKKSSYVVEIKELEGVD